MSSAVVEGSEVMQGFEHRLHEIEETALLRWYESHEGPQIGIVSGDGHLSTFNLWLSLSMETSE
jgi:hypothetical protein